MARYHQLLAITTLILGAVVLPVVAAMEIAVWRECLITNSWVYCFRVFD